MRAEAAPKASPLRPDAPIAATPSLTAQAGRSFHSLFSPSLGEVDGPRTHRADYWLPRRSSVVSGQREAINELRPCLIVPQDLILRIAVRNYVKHLEDTTNNWHLA